MQSDFGMKDKERKQFSQRMTSDKRNYQTYFWHKEVSAITWGFFTCDTLHVACTCGVLTQYKC